MGCIYFRCGVFRVASIRISTGQPSGYVVADHGKFRANPPVRIDCLIRPEPLGCVQYNLDVLDVCWSDGAVVASNHRKVSRPEVNSAFGDPGCPTDGELVLPTSSAPPRAATDRRVGIPAREAVAATLQRSCAPYALLADGARHDRNSLLAARRPRTSPRWACRVWRVAAVARIDAGPSLRNPTSSLSIHDCYDIAFQRTGCRRGSTLSVAPGEPARCAGSGALRLYFLAVVDCDCRCHLLCRSGCISCRDE